MATSFDPAFHAFLAERRGPMIEAYVRGLTERIAFYRGRPRDLLLPEATSLVEALLESVRTGDHDHAVQAVGAILADRPRQGLTFEQALQLGALGRSLTIERALEAIEAKVPGARDGLRRLEALNDAVTTRVAAFFQSTLESAQRALAESESYHRSLYERLPAMMHTIDAQGRIVVVNDRWLTRLGYRRQEVLGRHSAEFMTPASARHAREEILPALFEKGRGDNVPCQFLGKHGEVVDMLLSGYLERGREGGPQRVRAVLTDVSEQMRMARALQESEIRYRALVELAPDGVAVLENARIAYLNQAGARLLGADDPAALVGRDITQLAPFTDPDALRARLREAEARGEPLAATEQLMRGEGGEPLVLELVAAPIIYEGIPALHIVLRDVTERRRAEEARRVSALQEETIRAQQELVRSLSTPLVPLGNGVILAPLVGAIDRTRTEQLLHVLLEGVTAHAARTAILDVTGVPSMDAQVASSLARATRAVSLIGAEVVLTGLSPSAARTLVELGFDLSGLTVRATLRDGIIHALGEPRVRP